MTDTIFALASAPGRAGVAVFRVSGSEAGRAVEGLSGKPVPEGRKAVLRQLWTADGAAIDQALVLYFPAPHSFTGEDVAEFHIHGGPAVIAALSEALAVQPGCRPAEPGEFSRRAFENGKLDLTQAEAIADLVDAETQAQHRQALRQMEGQLGAIYEGWRARLLNALAHLEADIDFPDEDLPDEIAPGVLDDVRGLSLELAGHLADARRGERIREGIAVAVIGPPNAGKSSLINALAKRDVAIVSPQPGTTRDVIEVHLNLGGYAVTLADTAGLREAADSIEDEGVRRALQRAETADLRLIVFDGSIGDPDAALRALASENDLLIANKADLFAVAPAGALAISAADGRGLPDLLDALTARIADKFAAAEAPPLTRLRHRLALQDCAEALDRALVAPELELAAEDVRLAVRALGRITGRVDVEDVLDAIFRDFCIGK